jgi:hypothetical protein
MDKIRFVVCDENLFGYILPQLPNDVWILATSVIRGSIYTWKDGSAPVPMDKSKMRPATRADFDTYRICPKGYDNDPARYDFPAN